MVEFPDLRRGISDTSIYGDDPDLFFQNLLCLLYDHAEVDIKILTGNYNARVGNRKDYIETVANLPQRTVIDEMVNDHGTSLINFLLQSNTCIVNGWCNPLENSFTSVSHRGRAAVDYFIVPTENFNSVTDFRVRQVNDALQEFGLIQIAHGTVSDHVILCLSVTMISSESEKSHNTQTWECDECDLPGEAGKAGEAGAHARHNNRNIQAHQTVHSQTKDKFHTLPTRYKIHNIPDDIMYSSKTVEECTDMIYELLRQRLEQEQLDKLYEQYVETYHSEMSLFYKELDRTPHSEKAVRHTKKPYWSES